MTVNFSQEIKKNRRKHKNLVYKKLFFCKDFIIDDDDAITTTAAIVKSVSITITITAAIIIDDISNSMNYD